MNELVSLAAEINEAHAAASQAVRSGLVHARRAGDLLIAAKRQVEHGSWLPWLADRCPTISERTAQGYMRLARCWPRLDGEANTQRVADLSLREALTVLARDTSRLMSLPAESQEAALERVEQGAKMTVVVGEVYRQQRMARTFRPPPSLTPLTVDDGRKRRLLRHAELTLWQVQVSPNAAGLQLKTLVEEQRQSPAYQQAIAEVDALRAKGARLEELAKETRARADEQERAAEHAIADALVEAHGEIYHMCETFDFRVVDPEMDAHLLTITQGDAIIDWLFAHRGDAAHEVRRGLWGDMLLMRYSSHRCQPALNGNEPGRWDGIGDMSGMWTDDETHAETLDSTNHQWSGPVPPPSTPPATAAPAAATTAIANAPVLPPPAKRARLKKP